MASKKKKGGSKSRAKKAKPKRSTGRGATRAKPKAGARKAAARPKAGARKAAAKSRSTGAKRAPARKPASRTVAKAKSRKAAVVKPSTGRTAPPILDEVLEEPLLDASTILRVKDSVARSQRDIDEDALRQFPDPSLVIDVDTSDIVRVDVEDADESGLFAAEARRQEAARAAEPRPAVAAQTKRHDGSLFGSLQSEGDSDTDSEDED